MVSRDVGKKLAYLITVLCAFCLGCASPGAKPAEISLPVQDATLYLKTPWQVEPAVQKALYRQFMDEYFSCWNEPEPRVGLEAMLEAFDKAKLSPGLAENLLPRSSKWYQDLADLADFGDYPNRAWRGLTLGWVEMRVFPTAKPALYNADRPGSMMFDSLQQSLLHPGMPVFVHHISKDGAWLMVQTPIAWGWLPVNRVARLNRTQASRWQSGPFTAFTNDNVTLKDKAGRFVFKAGIGCLLPVADGPDRVLAVRADSELRAVLVEAVFDRDFTANHPMGLSSKNLAVIVNRLLGSPYGWGGRYGNRDCSATLQDLFRTFGLWLPRNSTDQAATGRVFSLDGMPDNKKEALLLEQGLPGLTLVHLPGHIMLFLGRDGNEPMVFHNTWGLRVVNLLGHEGRAMLGRAVITNLRPGRELLLMPQPEGFLVNRADSFNLLVDRGDLIAN
ncbi:SH3 domain-containing C40 family peptidase [Dethiosulfatarculus sandiegensis]|uniref:Glycoside hydrolase n=1 Tax=Dethiosulfatarculus sandiegensis TaxID=1429043 RepID=A0A0D2J9J7_9BACT|nr:SH3 domain-containing C40 family peptidase [Dethiosulfatarculus sandiegensis]KIX14814.1 hypothetical protein X474_06625 [Dethiosulfatarculus sandiegensis]